MVRRHRAGDVPVALLHRDLVAERTHQLVARRGRHAAELDRRAVAADRLDPDRLLVGIDRGEAVEIGQVLVVIVGVAHPLDRLAGLVAGEFEGAGAHHILFVPVRVLVEDRLLVDPVERIGQCRQEGAGREFEMEHDGRGIGRLDLVDHQVIGGARAEHPLAREDDLVPAGRHIGGGQRRTVMEFDAVADLEGVGPPGVGRLRHLAAQIADEIGGRCRVVRVDPDQQAVERRGAVRRGVGAFAVSVEARRCVRRDHVGQGPAAFRHLRGRYADRQHKRGQQHRGGMRQQQPHAFLPFGVLVVVQHHLSSQIVARSWLT